MAESLIWRPSIVTPAPVETSSIVSVFMPEEKVICCETVVVEDNSFDDDTTIPFVLKLVPGHTNFVIDEFPRIAAFDVIPDGRVEAFGIRASKFDKVSVSPNA